MFFSVSGEIYRTLLRTDEGVWAISCDSPTAPCFVAATQYGSYEKCAAPAGCHIETPATQTTAQEYRLGLIQPLLDETVCIYDAAIRRKIIKEIADREHTTIRRIYRLYYSYLAYRCFSRKQKIRRERSLDEKYAVFKWAIDKFYFSAKRFSLRTSYDLMLAQKYTMENGELMENIPSWSSFRHYYYNNNFHRRSQKGVSREGLSNFQRNERLLSGSAMLWRDKIGAFQMDATEADIYLVSRYNRKKVIGRPYIYLAVDTVTQLIAGIYVGMASGSEAVIACLANAAEDKVAFCKKYDIDISEEEWPNRGLPGEVITDKGREFTGSRFDEMLSYYGIERETLPPFRPDYKGIVEKSFDLLQSRYKPFLRGKGVIEPNAQERWSTDYTQQATFDLYEFTQIIIHCVVYLNGHRVIESYMPNAEIAEQNIEPIPAKLWSWYESMNRSTTVYVTPEEIKRITLPRTQSKLGRDGISLNGLKYGSTDYAHFVQKYGTRKNIPIAYNPENVSCIYLLEGGEYIPFGLMSKFVQYKGLTAHEYALAKEDIRVTKKQLERQDIEARVAVARNISKLIENTTYAEGE